MRKNYTEKKQLKTGAFGEQEEETIKGIKLKDVCILLFE